MDLGASTGALRTHAAFCAGLAADLDAGLAPPPGPHPYQSTTAAVAAVHAMIGTVRSALAHRLRSTGAAVAATAETLEGHDTAAAAALGSTTPAQLPDST